MDIVDKDHIYSEVRAKLKLVPDHTFNTLNEKEQNEFMELLLKGQGYYIKEGIKAGAKEIALPGFGTFLYNPLKKLATSIHKQFAKTLYDFEIRQLIKEKFVEYVAEHGKPMTRTRGAVYIVDLKLPKKDSNA